MEDLYYSKKLKRHFPTRLDFLLYAHDGRGLGHASRAVAVGLALRRLYPDKKVLFISGCAETKMLIGPAPLDWIKLPSYQTVLKGGVSEGRDGSAGFYKSVLGRLRSEMIAALVSILRPRCVLVDHSPAGKREELIQALQGSAAKNTRWILGLRAIVGEDREIWSDQAAALFCRHYHGIIWYGDGAVLGEAPPQRIHRHFKHKPFEAGYVSRLQELQPHLALGPRQLAGTVSLPWLGEHGQQLVDSLYAALQSIGPAPGQWHLFVPEASAARLKAQFGDLAFCNVLPISEHYFSSLLQSRVALIYGGYNSLIDIAAGKLPAVIVLRGTQDKEQPSHVDQLRNAGSAWRFFSETEVNARSLTRALFDLLDSRTLSPKPFPIDGAAKTARFLHTCLHRR